MNILTSWGSNSKDRQSDFGCDELIKDPNSIWYRAVDVNAPAGLVYKWICQMKIAPYSYDNLDNRGNQSPQNLEPGTDKLKKGQKMMTIFNIESFTPGKEINLTMDMPPKEWAKWYVPSAISYKIETSAKNKSRIIVKYIAKWPYTLRGWFERYLIVIADFIMMRRQLLNFKKLAERDFSKGMV